MRRLPRIRTGLPSAVSPYRLILHVYQSPPNPTLRCLSTTPRDAFFFKERPSPDDKHDPYKDRPDPSDRSDALHRDRESAADISEAEYEAYLAEQAATEEAAQRPARPTSRLVLTPSRSSAPKPAQIDDPEYVAATTAEGLEEVGGLEGWWDRPGHWGSESRFVGFAPAHKIEDRDVLQVLVRQAVVEACALRLAGREGALTEPLAAPTRDSVQAAMGVGVNVDGEGAVSLGGDAEAMVQSLLAAPAATEILEGELEIEEGEAVAEAPTEEMFSATELLQTTEAREFSSSEDGNWNAISLQDPRLKFAVNKRVFQLTGHAVPDAKLAGVATAADLLAIVVKPPKPFKLFQLLEQQGELADLPNVAVSPRRVTPIDKEKALGRWKVIEQELEKRGLPATGFGVFEKGREREWILGKKR